MRRLFKALKWIVILAGALVSLVLVALVCVLIRPEWLINPTTLQWGANYARKAGIDIRWKTANVKVESISLLKKRFDFEWSELCSVVEHSPADGCFKEARLGFVVQLSSFPPRIEEIGPVHFLDGEVTLNEPKENAPPARADEKAETDGVVVPKWISTLKLYDVRIDVDQWKGKIAGKKREGNLLLASAEKGQKAQWDLRIEETAGKNPSKISLGLGAEGRHYKVKGSLAQARGKAFHTLASLGIEGTAKETELMGRIDAQVHGMIPKVKRLSLQNCRFQVAQAEAAEGGDEMRARSDLDGRVKLNCPVELNIPVPPVKTIPGFRFPTKTRVIMTANLKTSFPPSPSEPVEGVFAAELEPFFTPLLEGEGNISTELAGVPNEFPNDWKLDAAIRVGARVPKFEDAVKELWETPWAVPAPINVLKGHVAFAVEGKTQLTGGEFPVTFETRLRSKTQKLNLDGDGVVALGSLGQGEQAGRQEKNRVQAKLVLSDVQLALPKLDLEKPPRFIPDPRITAKKKKKSEKAPSNWDVSFEVATPPGHPALFLSNLAKKPVPVNVALSSASGGPMRGTIRISDFPLELFRRDAKVERFNLTFRPELDRQEIDGSILFNYTDYELRILLFGTSDQPQIKLVSEPPLPEDQLVAVLLFGRPLEELDSNQEQSVGTMRSALADGAVGLASLYVLASTPIESVGYDPGTGMFSAKVRLAEGTSLNVGSASGDLDQVGIRRRLGSKWTITTDLTRRSANEGQTATAFLEWGHRY